MNKKPTLSFKVVDGLLIALAILPILALIVLKILFTPASQGIEISGALIYFTIPMPLQDMPVTESQVNSLAVIITVTSLCLYITHGIRAKVKTKRQILAEWIVEKVEGMVRGKIVEELL